jgi:hypothetical protein
MANCDVEMAIRGTVDCIENSLTKAILISSDGDFSSPVMFWLKRGLEIKLISPADAKKCSYLLRKIGVPITYLSQVISRFTNEKALDEDETS